MKHGFAHAAANSAGGSVDYRLARDRVVRAFTSGEATRSEVCDAQSELMRNARECGTSLEQRCPICHDADLVQVTYVFVPRLPAAGRCMVTDGDYARSFAPPGADEGPLPVSVRFRRGGRSATIH